MIAYPASDLLPGEDVPVIKKIIITDQHTNDILVAEKNVIPNVLPAFQYHQDIRRRHRFEDWKLFEPWDYSQLIHRYIKENIH